MVFLSNCLKKIIIAASGGGAAVAAVTIAFVLLVPTQDYMLSVDPMMSKGDFGTYTHVFIKNTGREPVTNVKVDYGNQKSDFVPVLDPGDRVMLSPPAGSDLEQVKVTADNGIDIVKQYTTPANAPMIGNGGFGQ